MTSYPVIILGAGGHAKVLIDALKSCAIEIIGIADKDTSRVGTDILGIKVIGSDEIVRDYSPGSMRLVNGVGSLGVTDLRKSVYDKFKLLGFVFADVIHPSAVVARDVILGEGAQIMAGAIIQPGCRIGDNVLINTGVSIDHDCEVNDHVHLAPRTVLSGQVTIGAMSHVGTSAVIIQGINVGASTLIGAGALVVNNIPSGVKALGIPARVCKK